MGCSSSTATSQTSQPGRTGGQKEKVTLGYWDVRGGPRGNGTRYILAYAGVKYTEKTYRQGTDDWRNAKPSFGPFSNVPYLQVDDFWVNETLAVQQYIATKFKPELLGRTPEERARTNMLHCIVYDK